ncbi:LysR family transcriptional regulator [Mycobacterium sp. DL440]|uniref:LysR family transcriptional regulator n=1 Tax=Mycobacterium sp. DL440 TaxID=2675523 RepID=UPI001423D3B1|nr:LysR family transcriptional regulator [Mycobacterium sp. DL440]
MDLRHLRYFLAVAETLNYTRAAERLMMAASPLSRSIQQLEAELGGPLFVRGTRKVELTALGEALIPHAERTLADVDRLKREMHHRVLGRPEFRVGMRSIPGELIDAVVDDVIRQVEPDALIRLDPLDSLPQLDQLLNGRLALGMINRLVDDARLDYIPILLEQAGIALPDRPEYARLTEVRPEHLTELRLLVQQSVEPFGTHLKEYLDAVTDVVHLTTAIIGGLPTLVARGDACCLTVANPRSPWHRYLAGEGVIIRPLPATFPKATTYLAWRVDRDAPDDLGPILAAARSRFAVPIDR